MLKRYIRPFFREGFELFFHINMKKLKNQAGNEMFRLNGLNLDLDPGR